MDEDEIGEVGLEKVHETAQETASENAYRVPWLRWLALSTACFAVLAAIAALESGQYVAEAMLDMNESTLRQTQAVDTWTHYQAKGIKATVHDVEAEILRTTNAPERSMRAQSEAARLRSEQAEVEREAPRLAVEQRMLIERSRKSLEHHHRFAHAVTLFQVVMGLSAVAVLLERRWIWLLALALGTGGVALFAWSLLQLRY